MSILHAIVLGIVQGLSEFFPISSSAHLELTRWLFGWDTLSGELETSFDVAVHLGTLIGAICYLRTDIAKYVVAGLAPLRRRALSNDGRIGWFLLVSALPAGLVGVVFADLIDSFEGIAPIAILLIAFGLLLLCADRCAEDRVQDEFTLGDAFVMGIGQMLALQPGVSRSGMTLTVARLLKFKREAAARLVFLMSLPVIAGAGVYSLWGTNIPSSFWPPFLWAAASSALTGFVAVWGTVRLVGRHRFTPFVWYRVILGLVVLGILVSGLR